jgi:hypothetical protein
MSNQNQLLDPIGTLCKLVGLNFTKLKTKIKIQNHVLTLDKPDELQSFMRWFNRDGKNNISELYHVVTRIIHWYLIPDKDKNEDNNEKYKNNKKNKKNKNKVDKVDKEDKVENNEVDKVSEGEYDKEVVEVKTDTKKENSIHLAKCPEFIKMVNYLCDAFSKLQDTYEFGNVVLAIQFYINLLQNALKNNKLDSLPGCVLKKDNHDVNLLNYDKIKNLWNTTKIKRVCDLYDNCFSVVNNSEIEPEIKDALIAGYLKSVNAILQVTDKEFQKLIYNSNRG